MGAAAHARGAHCQGSRAGFQLWAFALHTFFHEGGFGSCPEQLAKMKAECHLILHHWAAFFPKHTFKPKQIVSSSGLMVGFLTFLLLRGLCHFTLAGCGPFCVSLLLFQPHLTDPGPLSRVSRVHSWLPPAHPSGAGPGIAAGCGCAEAGFPPSACCWHCLLQPRILPSLLPLPRAQVGGSAWSRSQTAWSRSQTPRSFLARLLYNCPSFYWCWGFSSPVSGLCTSPSWIPHRWEPFTGEKNGTQTLQRITFPLCFFKKCLGLVCALFFPLHLGIVWPSELLVTTLFIHVFFLIVLSPDKHGLETLYPSILDVVQTIKGLECGINYSRQHRCQAKMSKPPFFQVVHTQDFVSCLFNSKKKKKRVFSFHLHWQLWILSATFYTDKPLHTQQFLVARWRCDSHHFQKHLGPTLSLVFVLQPCVMEI